MYCSSCGKETSDRSALCAFCGSKLEAGDKDKKMAVLSEQVNAVAVEYAGFWPRFAAAFIDVIIVFFIFSMLTFPIVGFIIGPLLLSLGLAEPESDAVYIMFWTGLSLSWLYYAIMEGSSWQATFGKIACGIIVTDGEGYRISFARATGRQFAKIISGLVLLLGYLMVPFTKRKQGLHDMVSGTLVVMGGKAKREVFIKITEPNKWSSEIYKKILGFVALFGILWVVLDFIRNDRATDLVYWVFAGAAVAWGLLTVTIIILFPIQKRHEITPSSLLHSAMMIIGIGVPIVLSCTIDSMEPAGGAWMIYLIIIYSYYLYRIIKKEPNPMF